MSGGTHDIRFNYEDVPTLGEFTDSDAYIRGIMGPVGSGKSSASAIEIVKRGREQKPGPDGIRRTRWAVVRNCFDDQTQILTETRGWQLFRNLLPEDKVASLVDGKLVFVLPSYYYAARHKGEMIGLRSDGIDMLVTPTHHLWSSKRKTRKKVWSDYAHERACDAYGRSLRRFKRDAIWEGGNARYSVDFYEFLGFWFAEGYAGVYQYKGRKAPHYRFVVVQKEVGYTRDLLRRAGLRWGENKSKVSGCTYFRIKITDDMKPLVAELAALGKSPHKHLPQWLKDAPADHAMAFLTGYWRGDGGKRSRPRRSIVATTASHRLADDMQEMALRAGMVANVGRHRLKPYAGRFKTAQTEYSSVTFMSPARSEPTAKGWYKTDYDAMVYCVEVPSHVVYVRRNGKAHWSGQTFRELEDTTIKTFHQWFPPEYFGRYYAADHRYVIKAFDKTEIEILFRALDKPGDIKKLLSLELTGAWINEAREVPWAIVDNLFGRLGRYPAQRDGGATWYGLWMDTNPPDLDSQWYKFFEEGAWRASFKEMVDSGAFPADMPPEKFAAIFRQPGGLDDNAENLPNLPGGRRYYQVQKVGKGKDWIGVYIDAEYGFVMDGKAVFSDYNDKTHCQAVEPVPDVTIYRSWDFGLTPACTFSQVLPDGRLLFFAEMTTTRMGIERFATDVLNHCAKAFPKGTKFFDIGDPTGDTPADTDERSCFDIMRGKGIDIEGGDNNLTIRLESVTYALTTMVAGEARFIVHPRCKVLRKGFKGGYHFKRVQVSGAARYQDKPYKNEFSHPMDTVEYVCVKLFGGGLTQSALPDDDMPEPDYSSDIGRSSVTGY